MPCIMFQTTINRLIIINKIIELTIELIDPLNMPTRTKIKVKNGKTCETNALLA